jgi:hypothetical protein
MADAAHSHEQDAIRKGCRGVELLPVTKDAIIADLGEKFGGYIRLEYETYAGTSSLASAKLLIGKMRSLDLPQRLFALDHGCPQH